VRCGTLDLAELIEAAVRRGPAPPAREAGPSTGWRRPPAQAGTNGRMGKRRAAGPAWPRTRRRTDLYREARRTASNAADLRVGNKLRAHLLYGEGLRRKRVRGDAGATPAISFAQLSDLRLRPAPCFWRRGVARTGCTRPAERATKRTEKMRQALTASESPYSPAGRYPGRLQHRDRRDCFSCSSGPANVAYHFFFFFFCGKYSPRSAQLRRRAPYALPDTQMGQPGLRQELRRKASIRMAYQTAGYDLTLRM